MVTNRATYETANGSRDVGHMGQIRKKLRNSSLLQPVLFPNARAWRFAGAAAAVMAALFLVWRHF